MDPSQLLEHIPVAQLGFGGIAGAVVGYASKKVAKLTALLLGVVFIILQLLAYNGYISIDWGAVETSAQHAWVNPQGVTMADRLWAMLSANLPFGAAFGAGFVIGFKLG